MDKQKIVQMTTETRKYVDNSNLPYKDEVVKILDSFSWVLNFAEKLGIIDSLLNGLKEKPKVDHSNNINTLDSLDVNQNKDQTETPKEKILRYFLYILPYLHRIIEFVRKAHSCCESNTKLQAEIELSKLDKAIFALQAAGYLLNFGLLIWGFWVVGSTKSNLTKEKN